METASRRSHLGVAVDLRREPHRFEFFQAVRLLELESSLAGKQASIGFDDPPQREPVRLRAAPGLSFPSCSLPQAGTGEDQVVELRQSSFTLVGTLGALPQHYTELVLKRIQLKDFSLRDFLDVFHHRSAAFFYRAWRKYRFPFEFEHAQRRGKQADDFTLTLRALVGLGTGGLGRDDAPAWMYFAGLFANPRRSVVGLEGLLTDVLDTPVAIEQFVGRWLELEPDQCSRLSSASGDDEYRRLGMGFVLGTRVWDVQTAIRARVGPLRRADFVSLLPGTERHARVEALVRDYLNADVACEMELSLAPGEAAPVRLGGPSRLGQDAFLEAGASSSKPVRVRMALRTDRSTLAQRKPSDDLN